MVFSITYIQYIVIIFCRVILTQFVIDQILISLVDVLVFISSCKSYISIINKLQLIDIYIVFVYLRIHLLFRTYLISIICKTHVREMMKASAYTTSYMETQMITVC